MSAALSQSGSSTRRLPSAHPCAWFLLAAVFLASCGGYFNPHVDLVLHVSTDEAGTEVAAVIGRFALERKLIPSPAEMGSPAPESIKEMNARTTYYGTGERYGRGRALTFFDASPSCKVVRVIERSRAWNAESQADLEALRSALQAVEHVVVEKGAVFDAKTEPGRGIDEYCRFTIGGTPG